MMNRSQFDVQFCWELGVFGDTLTPTTGCVKVIPAEGTVAPGVSLTCQIEYKAGAESEIFDLDIVLVATPLGPVVDDESAVSDEAADIVVAIDPPR